ncbi:MAG: GNAT family N-acetyltransferase, partial [Erysipelotrichaceae bacterium]
MEVVVKKYQELTLDELYQILKVRNEVFVVEQNCPYQDIDDKDQFSIHVMAKESNQVVGYVRVFASKDKKGYGQIGRVLTTKRKSGIGALVFEKGIQVSKKQLELEN